MNRFYVGREEQKELEKAANEKLLASKKLPTQRKKLKQADSTASKGGRKKRIPSSDEEQPYSGDSAFGSESENEYIG